MLDQKQEYWISVDIGGTNTKFGIVNHRGEIIKKGNDLPTNKFLKAEDFVEALYQSLRPGIDEVEIEKIKGVGVGAPNANYYTGNIENAPNLNWKGVVPLAQLIAERFNLPCSITNDANAAAVGEMMYGAAWGMKEFIVITLGTGVGSGIVSNGLLVLGHDGFAGGIRTYHYQAGRKEALVNWSIWFFGSLCFGYWYRNDGKGTSGKE